MRKLYLFLTALFCFTYSFSQVTLIDPATVGGFESGADFAANGWTVVNGSNTTRAWQVGTGQAGYSGTKAAFIGDNSTTVGTTTSSRTVHFYRSVTIPAGATNITLSFKYKQAVSDYSASGPTYYDYVAVYMNSSAPVSGSLPSSGLVFGPYPNADLPNFTTQTVTIPNSYAGTTNNLVFTFKSDGVTPHGYGAVDDISLTYTLPTCGYPVSVNTSNTTSTSTDVSWTAPSIGTPTGYQWEVRTSGAAGSGAAGLTASGTTSGLTVNVTGLTAITSYTAYVRTNCGAGGFSEWSSVNFSTIPANDNCATATALTVNSSTNCTSVMTGSTVGATASGTTTSGCTIAGTPDDDVWYSFVATASSHIVSLYNVSGTVTDMAFQVLSGPCGGSMTSLVCSDPDVAVVTGLTPGNTYYIRVYTYSSTTTDRANFNICVSTMSNDDCANAISLTVSNNANCAATVTGSTYSATASGTTTSGCTIVGTADDDVWYSFVATGTSHVVTLSNAYGGTTDMAFQVLSGPCGSAMTSLVCSDPNSATVTGLTIGNTYYVRVFTYTSTTTTRANFSICVTGTDMGYVSSTGTQASTTAVTAGNGNVQVIRADVAVIGTTNPLSVTQLQFNTNGTTNTADLANAKVYYTGTSSTFSTTTQFGSTINNPNGTLTFTGSQALTGGSSSTTNYFWLAYTLNCAATTSNVIDGEFTSVTVGGNAQTPTTTAPSGTRSISAFTAAVATNQPSTASATAGSVNVQVLRADVTGSSSCGNLTQLNFSTTGSTSAADITKARVYYTGTSSTFSTATQFGSDVLAPNGSFSVTGSTALGDGTNYFWLVYDISCSATATDVLDASLASAVYNGATLTPATPNPTGTRSITANSGYTAIADGNWSAASTWQCGTVPPTDPTISVTISSNVVVDGSFTIGSVTITSGKKLTIQNGSTLTIGGGAGFNNKTLAVSGTLEVTGGTLNINGNLNCASGSTFNQSGGNINVDGNAAGVTANSVATGTYLVSLNSQNISWTGGTFTIVDPHAGAGSSDYCFYYNNSTASVDVSPAHTIVVGNGTSTDAGGSSNGFYFDTYESSYRINFGSMIVNGPSGTNRTLTSVYSMPVRGDLTINNGGNYQLSTTYLGGNLNVNAGGTLTNTGTFYLSGFSGTSTSASTTAQTLNSAGTLRNSATTPTANFASLTINNTNAAGVTFNFNPSVSSTLTLTDGNVNMGANTLTVGISTATPGTVSFNTGRIIGAMKRWISGTGVYNFPVGFGPNTRNAAINFTTAPTTGGTLTTRWVATAGGNNGLPLTEGAINVFRSSYDGFWHIDAADGLAGGVYTGTFTPNGLNGVLDYTKLVLLKRADASSPWTLNGTHVTTTGSNIAPVLSRTGMSGFSEFGIGGGSENPLPVTGLDFSGAVDGDANVLRWTTATEANNKGFIVERSADGRTFGSIAFIGSKAEGGNSTSVLSYRFDDVKAFAGDNYYRLKQVDKDGQAQYSKVIVLTRKISEITLSAYPNPSVKEVNIRLTSPRSEKITIIVTDLSGKIVMQQHAQLTTGSNITPLNIAQLTAGTYLVKAVCDNGCETATARIVKQ